MKTIFFTVIILLLASCATSNSSSYSSRKAPSVATFEKNAAIPIKTFPAQYPARASRNNLEGWVMFEFNLTENGKVNNLMVVDSYPEQTFVKEASKAIKKWTFQNTESAEPYKYIMEFKLGGR